MKPQTVVQTQPVHKTARYVVPGIPHPNKRRNTTSEGSDSEEDPAEEEEPFVDIPGQN